MSNVAVIAEYNPFHNGHQYHLNKAKELTGADHLVAIMSGNFLQRGVPALIDKYTRAYMAASAGVDLVFELPFPFAASAAGDFALAGVIMLNKLHAADYLAFGAECDNLKLLQDISEILVLEPDNYKTALKSSLADGASFPAARAAALSKVTGSLQTADIMRNPNNILAVEYLSALTRTKSHIKPVLIVREQAGYNSTDINSSICSANAIRELIYSDSDFDRVKDKIKSVVPETVYKKLMDSYAVNWPCQADDLSSILGYLLIRDKAFLYEYLGDDIDLANRILKYDSRCSFTELAEAVKSRNYTLTHINRSLLRIVSGMKIQDINEFKAKGWIYYGNILALRKSSSHILRDIYKSSEVPIINRKSDFKLLSDTALKMAGYDINATDIYNRMLYENYKTILPGEYQCNIQLV
jgi:predicted nucleotidyltransferase